MKIAAPSRKSERNAFVKVLYLERSEKEWL